jgi:transposase
MARPLLPDKAWAAIEPLLPRRTPSPKGGRPPVPNRQALVGILFILRTGMAWEDLPAELNCGCGMTCWRRLRDWQQDGTWDRIHGALLESLHDAKKIDWSRAAIDSSSVRAVFGGTVQAPTPQTGASWEASTT